MEQGTVQTKGRYFPVILQAEDESGYFVSCPLFEGCFSQGQNIEEALKNIREAIELCLEDEKSRSIREVSMHMVEL